MFGQGFTVNERIKHLATDFKVKTPRICKIRVRAAVKFVRKKVASMYLWSETRERNVAKKYNYELYEAFNEPNIVNYLCILDRASF